MVKLSLSILWGVSVLADKTVEIEEKITNLVHPNAAVGGNLLGTTTGLWTFAHVPLTVTTEQAYMGDKSIKAVWNRPGYGFGVHNGIMQGFWAPPNTPFSFMCVLKGTSGTNISVGFETAYFNGPDKVFKGPLVYTNHTFTGGWDTVTVGGTTPSDDALIINTIYKTDNDTSPVYLGAACLRNEENNYQWTYPSFRFDDTAYWPKRKLLTADFPKKNILKPHHALPTSTIGYTSPSWAPLTFDPNDKVMGYGSLKSTCDGTNFYQFIHLTPPFPVTNGDTVTLKAWVKGSPYSGHYIRGAIRCHRITGGYTDLEQGGIPCDGTWKEVSFTKTIPEGTTSIDFFFDRPTAYTNTTLHLNVAQLEISSTPTEYQDPTLDTITQPITNRTTGTDAGTATDTTQKTQIDNITNITDDPPINTKVTLLPQAQQVGGNEIPRGTISPGGPSLGNLYIVMPIDFGYIYVFSPETGAYITSIPLFRARGVDFTPDGRYLIAGSGGSGTRLKIYDLQTEETVENTQLYKFDLRPKYIDGINGPRILGHFGWQGGSAIYTLSGTLLADFTGNASSASGAKPTGYNLKDPRDNKTKTIYISPEANGYIRYIEEDTEFNSIKYEQITAHRIIHTDSITTDQESTGRILIVSSNDDQDNSYLTVKNTYYNSNGFQSELWRQLSPTSKITTAYFLDPDNIIFNLKDGSIYIFNLPNITIEQVSPPVPDTYTYHMIITPDQKTIYLVAGASAMYDSDRTHRIYKVTFDSPETIQTLTAKHSQSEIGQQSETQTIKDKNTTQDSGATTETTNSKTTTIIFDPTTLTDTPITKAKPVITETKTITDTPSIQTHRVILKTPAPLLNESLTNYTKATITEAKTIPDTTNIKGRTTLTETKNITDSQTIKAKPSLTEQGTRTENLQSKRKTTTTDTTTATESTPLKARTTITDPTPQGVITPQSKAKISDTDTGTETTSILTEWRRKIIDHPGRNILPWDIYIPNPESFYTSPSCTIEVEEELNGHPTIRAKKTGIGNTHYLSQKYERGVQINRRGTYTATVKFRATPQKRITLTARLWFDDAYFTEYQSEEVEATGEWQTIRLTFTEPGLMPLKTTRNLQLYLSMDPGNTSDGYIEWGEAQLEESPIPTSITSPWTPNETISKTSKPVDMDLDMVIINRRKNIWI